MFQGHFPSFPRHREPSWAGCVQGGHRCCSCPGLSGDTAQAVILVFPAQQPGRDTLLLPAELPGCWQPRECCCASHSSWAALGVLLPFYPAGQLVCLMHCIAKLNPRFQFHGSIFLLLKRKWQHSLRRRRTELFCECGSAQVMKGRMLTGFPPEGDWLGFRIKKRNRRDRRAILRALSLLIYIFNFSPFLSWTGICLANMAYL